MLTISAFFVVISVVSCQIDGEFWWLHNDITKLRQGTAPPPQFDDVNELDTDETAKIVFRDSEVKEGKSLMIDKDKLSAIHFRDETELSKPFEFDKLNVNNEVWERPLKQVDVRNNISSQNTEDEFQFVFPNDDNFIWTDNENVKNKRPLATVNEIESSNKVSSTTKRQPQNVLVSDDNNYLLPEKICTFIKKSECIRSEGTLYEPWMLSNIKITIPDTQIVCCILPITTTMKTKIVFPDKYWTFKRHKRSNADGENPALKQRNVLMSRKYALENRQSRVTTPSTRKTFNQKITNSDEYPTDPYWNIKNPNIRNPNIPSYQDPDLESDYGVQSYGDDYTMELPKPGLVGLYSDNRQTQSTFTANKNKGFYYDTSDSGEDDDFEPSFGYSNIDPRRDRLTTKPVKPSRPKPSRLTAVSSKFPEHSLENPTITFHSNPDFQLLQGFKLLNLVRSKNRFTRKATENKKECADNGLQEESQKLSYFDKNYDNDLFESNLKQKLFNECGKTQRDHGDCENGLQSGIVEVGSHPWIALVVLTKSERRILCYATIVHPRVAVSIADCVNGQSPGTVSIIAGVRNLEELPQSQHRMATITLDPDYSPGNLQYNLALLHWLRPLIFDTRVQAACLGNPHTETEDNHCMFVGWGGYDQEMQSELRWQRASILSAQACNKRLSKLEVSDALCAAVQSRGTVTGVGGPLLCRNKDRWSAVGVAVWRNDVVILLPQRDWVITNMISLRIQ